MAQIQCNNYFEEVKFQPALLTSFAKLPLVLRMLLFLVLCCSLGYLAARACAFKYECFASTHTGKFARKALIANSHYDRLSVLSREMLSISNMKSAEVKKYVQDSEKNGCVLLLLFRLVHVNAISMGNGLSRPTRSSALQLLRKFVVVAG